MRCANVYVMFVEHKWGDWLTNGRDLNAFDQASLSVCRRWRSSKYDELMYDAVKRTHEYHVHDAFNRLDSVDDNLTVAVQTMQQVA